MFVDGIAFALMFYELGVLLPPLWFISMTPDVTMLMKIIYVFVYDGIFILYTLKTIARQSPSIV